MFEGQTIQSEGICSDISLSNEFMTQEPASIVNVIIQSWSLYGNCGWNNDFHYASLAGHEIIAAGS